MALEDCFEIGTEVRERFITGNILTKVPEEEREGVGVRTRTIVENYVGLDIDVLSILTYAVERGVFDTYAQKLEKHYEESLAFVHPEGRRSQEIPGAFRAHQFFLRCYEELGVKNSHFQ